MNTTEEWQELEAEINCVIPFHKKYRQPYKHLENLYTRIIKGMQTRNIEISEKARNKHCKCTVNHVKYGTGLHGLK
jgi:hypothetical protein